MKFKVPYTAFSLKNKPIKKKIIKTFEKVLDSGQYILGNETRMFEKEFSSYLNVKFATGISNGTCALHLALRTLKLKKNDEVITTPNSFIASAASIFLAGAKPIFVDVNKDLNINPDLIEESITSKTKAIMPVHLAGRPANMLKINKIAKKYGLFVLEDAAQSVGAKFNNKKVGSWGHAACFSLHPLKNLHAYGDAGIMVSNSQKLINEISINKNHGLVNRDHCKDWGFNCKLDELQSSFLRINLKLLDAWTKKRRKLAFRYNKLLSNFVEVPTEANNEFHVFQTYVIQVEKRDKLLSYLRKNGVEANVHYPTPIHLQPAAKYLNYNKRSFPMAYNLSKKILSLPLYPGLSLNKQDYIIKLISKFYR
ncbi:MAG: dTDP-3-amino-3,6-dideoxy-alpha-D-galactopyranose transaminase [Alphaproteobacteria bacterium MarineAlpha5_Bin8]|nr:MAG: dTDP-3-amino-3,6-dideoxy-alpha-D-galactopyranose transaminase [Alphaproteobacteria bacterium MarineAlpha5_Bin8]PPR54559.1 MAG: dTDP-3-amino-3,6-dideoxy-alpha-D-galactopyranose transaminase [Alphaproteobacteria bacterium MarineAlpha5_Bin6]|tara:strand:- start:7 stop:1107 length:1101 start_codon:yes stop_codon:yes gene_type:complete